MLEDGYIDKSAYDAAVSEPLHAREVYAEGNDAPYFVDFVKKELAERYPPQVLNGEGLRIFTSLDVHMEKLAEAAITHNLADLEAKHSKLARREAKDRLESCLVALEPQSGRLRRWPAGAITIRVSSNRVTQSKRQPGSVFKP